MKKRIILAITGASGSLYAVQFLKLMQQIDVEIHGIISDAGRLVLQHELGLTPDDLNECIVEWHAKDDFAAPMSSGSSKFDAMLVLPCTMGTLGAIANGITKNLVHRAADVMLKEKKPLLLAVRETPFNRIHHKLEEMATFFAGRMADLLGFEVDGLKRWQGV
jgi:4-hydroxy-3-polyprenylbenzoate decarboxylase